MKTIMQDIARIAGVSPGTVSNALNNRKGVGKDTKERIIKIAAELGYFRNSTKEVSNIIRFIIFKKHGLVVTDTPFFSALIEGIERECRSEGYEMLISQVIYKEHNNDDIFEIIKQEQLAGVLLLATEMNEEDLSHFEDISVPVIIIDSNFQNSNFDYVLMNNMGGAYQATKYLIKNGHTQVGYLGSSITINNFKNRFLGFKSAMGDEGLTIHPNYELLLEPTLEGAYRDMKNLLEEKDFKLPTAYFAFNDIIAFGAMRAMIEKGISIPEQVSIVGFDDMPFCEISTPRLTTVKVFKQYIGKKAVQRLIEKISEEDNTKLKIEINTEIVERESVRKI